MMWKIAWVCLAVSLLRIGVEGEERSRLIDVKSGSDVVLECDVASNKNIELIDWRLNNSKTAFFAKFMNFKPHISEQFTGRLHVVNQSAILISRVSLKDSGIYRCRTMVTSTSGGAGVFEQGTPIKLSVQVQRHPFFIKHPRSERVIIAEASTIHLQCHVGGIPHPKINWTRLGGNEMPSRRTTIYSLSDDLTTNRIPKIKNEWNQLDYERASSGLNISKAEASDAGRYMCSASNNVGVINHEFDVEVKHQCQGKFDFLKADQWKGNPQPIPSNRKATTEGFPAIFDCNIDSSISTTNARFIWTKDGADISSSPKAGVYLLVGGKLYIKNCNRTDSGVYKCTARKMDPTASRILTYQGQSVFLDVQFPPDIILIEDKVLAAVGSDARLPCVSKANPGTVTTKWTRGGRELTKPKYEVLQEGTLLIRSIKTSDAGSYTCTPSNSIRKGTPKSTRLVITIVPRFTQVPPSVKTIRVGKTISLVCKAVSDKGLPVKLTWIRTNGPLPVGRFKLNGGHITITNIKRDDHGEYVCLASTKEGTNKHSATVTVLSTPAPPNITVISRSGTKATIAWIPGYDGGYLQQFELWYKKSSDSDYQWKFTGRLSSSTTTYVLSGLELGVNYWFSVRGVNQEGAGRFSIPAFFDKNGPQLVPFSPEKPLPPTNVIVNITADGYYVSWDHEQVPGRPLVKNFVLEYRKKNSSAAWTRADEMVNGDQRVYLLRADLFEPESDYEFRVYAYAKKFSEPAYASKTYVIAPPVVGERKSAGSFIPIIAGILGSLAFIVLLCLVCFCFVQYSSRKKPEDKGSKKVHFLLPESSRSSQAQEGDLDADCNEYVDVKLRPEKVRFVPDKSDENSNGKHWRRKITKEDDFYLLSSCDHVFGGNIVNYTEGPSGVQLASPTSPKDKVKFFEDVEENGWFNCTLSRPASNEVRDSYDQFCRTPSDVGSRESLDREAQKRALYEHKGSKIHLVKKFDSNSSLQFDKGKQPIRGPRYKNLDEKLPARPDVALRQSKIHPHHWSSPAVYSNDFRGSQGSRDSDSDSVGSLGRRPRRRMHRPSSYYEGSIQPELNPITEQDSDTNLRCSCDDEQQHGESPKSSGLVEGNESSYLHLERTDSLKQPYTTDPKTWDDDSDGSVGKPYGPHPKETESILKSNESDSENSISPAHSLVSLTDSDVDGEIARNIEKDTIDSRRLSFSGEPDRSHLFRAGSYIKSIDSDSEISEKEDPKMKVYDPPHLAVNTVPATSNLDDSMYSDSMDQLKACDPFYKNKPITVHRTPSNASSGVYSVQVSSSETNSVDSPAVYRRNHKPNSFRSSATSSSGFESLSARGSVGSEPGPATNWYDIGKPYSRSFPKHRFPHLDEPYEWDREGTGSEFESGSETGGFSFKPNMIANMRHLLDLQRKLGIDLESSGSSNESLVDKKIDQIVEPEEVNGYGVEGPSKYNVDNYTTEEKDERCSKLMDEYKTNKKVQDEKLNGSMIYQSWDL